MNAVKAVASAAKGAVRTPSSPADVVRAYLLAFQAHDRAAVEALLSDDFVFSSPRDNNIDKRAFFERCWALSEAITSFSIEAIFAQGAELFVRYHARRAADGSDFRNTEFMRVEGGKIKVIDVYFERDLVA